MVVTQNVVILMISVSLCFDTPCLGYNIPFSNIFLSRTRRQTDTDFRDESCAPLNIVNGDYNIRGRTNDIKGTPIPNNSIVNITCKAGYGLFPNNPINLCISGVWSNLPLQECRQLCEPRISTSVNVTCTLDGSDIDCTKPVVEGTVAQSSCNRFYQPDYNDFPTSKCSGGSWNKPLIRCEPECGQLIPSGGTHVVGGHDAIRGEFPWHIGLYRFNSAKSAYEYQCGGSIITPLLVITAAHCVTSQFNVRFEPREFYVAAGKYYSDYDATDDSPGLVQKRQVQSYEIPRQYRAYYSNYEGDIAVILIANAFTLSNVVQPVCVDWNNIYEEQQLRPAQLGNVVGWGFIDPGKPKASETLKQLTAPYIDRLDCLDAVPQEFQRWVTTDKFCAGWTNGSSVCKGDSGGGIVFKWIHHNGRKIFYLRGLVSVGPLKEKQCDNYKYGVYTKISAHMKWITGVVTEVSENNTFMDGSCASLNIINGDYNVLGSGHIKGNPIPNLSIVNITCKAGYGLYPSDPLNTCISEVWNNLPLQECRQLCAPRISTSVQVKCSLDGKDIDCTKPVEGTVAQSRCDDFYSQINDDYPTSKCSRGTWDYPLIKCEPECGQPISYRATNIAGDFPWHIGLYRFNAEKSTYEYICGGSIITPLLVITAAACVTAPYYNIRYGTKDYIVAAGKHYTDYDDPRDNEVQKRQITKFEIPSLYAGRYAGGNTNLTHNIAVLILEKPFTLSSVVQPVCVDWSNKYEEEQLKPNQIGILVGWGWPDPAKPVGSEILKQFKLSYIDKAQCLDEIAKNFQKYVTPDKFCARWGNGTGVCGGDNGGGLVYKWQENNKIKYYLRGITSVIIAKTCDLNTFTKISEYLPFIKDVVAKNTGN